MTQPALSSQGIAEAVFNLYKRQLAPRQVNIHLMLSVHTIRPEQAAWVLPSLVR